MTHAEHRAYKKVDQRNRPCDLPYFKSLCDVFKRLTIKPDYPKHTNIKKLDVKIAEGVAMGTAISSASSIWIRKTKNLNSHNTYGY